VSGLGNAGARKPESGDGSWLFALVN
jgi:hypothetical protein